MSVCVKSLFITSILLICAAYQSIAGLIVEMEKYEKGGNQTVRATIYIQENKIKFFDEEGQFAAIFDLDTGEVIQIDNLSQTYSSTQADDYFTYYKQYASKMEAAMRKQLSELPPNKRAQAEDMMKRKGIDLPGNSGGPVTITYKNTGDTKKIAGCESVKYEIFADGRLKEEIWTTSDARFQEEIDMVKMTRYLSELRAIEHSLGGNGASGGTEKAYAEVFSSGFPMKTVDYPVYGNEIVEQTIKVKKEKIDRDEFMAPTSYRKVQLQEMLHLSN